MLDDIVAILVLNELFRIRVKFIQNRISLFRGTVLKDSLYNATPIGVSRQRVNL